jgi:hypothetical protein
MKRIILLSFLAFLCLLNTANSQVELVDADHPVYNFLQRMQVKQVITGYNPANLPLARYDIGNFLKIIGGKSRSLTPTDRSILNYYNTEFEKEVSGSLNNNPGLFNRWNNIFDNNKQKHLYVFSDSNASIFLDQLGSISVRNSSGDSLGSRSVVLGELGLRFRGSLFNSVGFYLRASNGQKLSGDTADFDFAIATDKRISATGNVRDFRHLYFDTFDGYLRYQTNTNWLGISAGRYAVYQGAGYIDRLFLSNNTVPFDFFKVDLKYKIFGYSFIYGSLRGDSLGTPLESKNISTHRFDVNFSDKFRMGFFESVVISNSPFSFTFFNPVSFLFSAEMNKASQGEEKNINNAMLGADMEVLPVKNLGVQASILIDDLDFQSLFKSNSEVSNKFGFQLGTLWTDAFTMPNLDLKLEYTRLNPFIYAHKTNKSNYTHWDFPLGHNLPPNSDEIAARLDFRFGSRLTAAILYRHQRSGNGFVLDSLGNILINYGGNIENGIGESNITPKFLGGNRVNRDIITFNLTWEPIRQYYIDFMYVNRSIENVFENRKLQDNYFFATLRVDY